MRQYGTYFRGKYEICIYGLLLISAILPVLLAVNNIVISPDSMMYALISQEILSGNGISLPMIYDLRDNFNFINGTVPVVLDPPLYSILLALFGGVTSQSFVAAQILNGICHLLISLFTFLLMKKLYDNKAIALLTGILVSFSLPMLWNAHHLISESLFVSLTVAALYFLILTRDSDNHIRNLFAAGICTSAAILTKYSGLSLMPVFFWGIYVSVKNKKINLRHMAHVLTALLPLITAVALFTRAYVMSGSIHGWKPPSPERSYADAITGTIKMIFTQFGLGDRPIVLLTIITACFILYIFINTHLRRELLKHLSSGLDLIILFIASHTFLIAHAMATSQTVFESRYVSPLVPFLFIVSMLIIAVEWEIIRRKGFYKLSLCWIVLTLGIITIGNSYKTGVHAGMFAHKQEKQYLILKSHTYNWIKETYGEDVIITSNRPYHLSFFGGYSTIRLPHRRFENNSWVPDDMKSYLPKRMSLFGSQVLALFEEADERYEGSYIAGLFHNRADDDNFVLIKEFPDGVVYKLRE